MRDEEILEKKMLKYPQCSELSALTWKRMS